MAKKNRTQTSSPKPKIFQVNPFSALKGVDLKESVSSEAVKPIEQKKEESEHSGADLFLQAVADVRPIQSSDKKRLEPVTERPQKAAAKVSERVMLADEHAFMEEVGRLKMDTRFSDNIPNEDELQPLAGNRLRQVKRGVVSVDYQLDLHGLKREEALDALKNFLNSARLKEQKAVLIITGKGNHSPEEPVLQQAVAGWLRDAGRATVLEFAPAPREMGGSGAYVVFLRELTLPI